jgi:hypothetical protein
MRVDVTRDQIACGGMSWFECPVALAMRAAMPDAESCYAGPLTLGVYVTRRGWVKVPTPAVVRAFLDRWYKRQVVEPFGFDLPALSAATTAGCSPSRPGPPG